MPPTPARTDGTALIDHDPWLAPHAAALRNRFGRLETVRRSFEPTGGLLGDVSLGHLYFGFNRGEYLGKAGVWYREWAPGALQLRLIGDFNGWDRFGHPMVRDEFGVWSLFLPDDKYRDRLTHGSRIKVHVVLPDGSTMDRIPAYARRVLQEPQSISFVGQYWSAEKPYEWRNTSPKLEHGLRIYESHVGMAQEEGRVGTYREFTDNVLPRIVRAGYNAIQLMAIQEHPYYGSFGYHVSNFFAPSSRFGTPEDLKHLIDTAHGYGLKVIMDLVHSHAVKNTHEGLNLFDGTDHQYFHAGPRGQHSAWDSMCFDYSKFEVLRFLLSNCRYWIEEFRFDGFRFDGVTSMLYLDHGLGKNFSSYDDYFDENVDRDAVTYLQLANDLIHQVQPDAIAVAEDVSGMVGIARPVAEGGVGFDYRLSMGVPDHWIKVLKEKTDDQWPMAELYHTLMNRRHAEKHVGYAESHDQALVGDKTLAFRLMDQEMYWNMAKGKQSGIVDRGIALHKMIRLITFSLAGEAYLNFMGNEFGHPEWIDFPREGNGYSYHYCRRQWSLAENDLLRYKGLGEFDRAMQKLDDQYNLQPDKFIERLLVHEDNKQLIFRRGPLVLVFNFHPTNSYSDWRIPVPDPADYKVILNTDARRFEGPGLCQEEQTYWIQRVPHDDRKQSLQIYVPARSAQVLAPVV
ncbi:MAG: alpha amylase C-terminal domain-containing protein [Burkholderiales bacterium]|nr:alpha amylase C-terminal domain-containing protein [Phycisphaerae bacterium]